MFITVKRHEREIEDLLDASNRLTDAVLKTSPQGLFLIDSKDKVLPQVSASMATLFRRHDFANLSLDKLIAPLVTAKSLSVARAFLTHLLDATAPFDPAQPHALQDLEVRLANPDGSHAAAHYSFEFSAVALPDEPRAWLVRVTDITARVQQQRELEDLRTQLQTQGEILRSVMQAGAARFGAFLQRTDASMQTINGVLKKPAREAGAFRNKLEETLEEVDRLRRDATALKLTAFTTAARLLEDSLQELRSRGELSGSDFLPLAVKLDLLYGQFALLRSLASQAGAATAPEADSAEEPMTENGTQVIAAPKFLPQRVKKPAQPKAHRVAQAGSLDSTLTALTELVAQEHKKTVVFDCTGMHLVPARYQATIKNVSIQLIRNAVMHGIEAPSERESAGKPKHGTVHLEFKAMPDNGFELHCQDDGCGLDPEKVRATAIAKGLVTAEAAARLRDRQVIKLIFKSGYSTLETTPGAAPHGAGMSLVRRYVHESGGKIALASLLGHETRFKVTLPALEAADASSSSAQSVDVQVA